MNDGWADTGWSQRERAPAASPRNRRTVEVVTCPTCESLWVERNKIVGPSSHWLCKEGKGCPNWKESAAVGEEGKAHIA